MADSDPNAPGDKTVKELLDAATQANLARWFGLPSFEQLADQGKPPAPHAEDPEFAEARRRRAAAIAAVDLRLLGDVDRRTQPARPMASFQQAIEVRVDPSIGFAPKMGGRPLAEPRDYERPGDIETELRESSPQALLRDLHRAELTFQMRFEWVDPLPEARLASSLVATEVMTMRWSLPHRPPVSPFHEARALVREAQRQRLEPWAEIKIPPRKVTW